MWSIRQVWPWSIKWSRAWVNSAAERARVLGQSARRLPTARDNATHGVTRWSTPKSDWLCYLQPNMEKLYTVSINKTWIWLWLRVWAPYCKIQASVEESREMTKAFRYDLNQIPYDYTVEVTNRFKGLHLVDWVPKELWMEVHNTV